ncbi:MAG: HAMP domain-containing protein [Deltaproteobacteria bacterium]|nr:HAMP domain-containing protein [Deltaproteobacteria bacterium]
MLERKKRRREFSIALAGLILVPVLIYIQLQYFSSVSVFFALFFLNVLIIMAILYVVLRNVVKLLLERRRRIIGSRLRTRLILAITGMSLIPCLIMFLVTAQFVKISVDFWFENQMETTVETSLDIARSAYSSAVDSLRRQGEFCLSEIGRLELLWGSPGISALLEEKCGEYSLSMLALLSSGYHEQFWFTGEKAEKGNPHYGKPVRFAMDDAWQRAKPGINWAEVDEKGFSAITGKNLSGNFIFCILKANIQLPALPPEPGRLSETNAAPASEQGYIVLARDMGVRFEQNVERVSTGVSEYRTVRSLKSELKATLFISLAALTAFIVLATVWFAFRVGRELTSPILALVGATERMADGDTSVRIDDSSSDEFAVLVKAFNRMATEIDQSRQKLTDTNDILAQQNLVLDQQRRYVETVLDNIASGVISFGVDWRINTANKAACEFLGQNPEDIIGRHITDFMPSSQSRESRKVAFRLLRQPSARQRHQLTFARDFEERRLLAISVGLPALEGKFQGGVVVFEDITEMEKMQRAAAWREVARRIAHEIKNPLTPIKLSAQRLEKKFGLEVDNPVFQQSTQLIVRQVEQLQSMVQEFSSFANLPEIRPRRGKILPVLEEAVNLFRNSHAGIAWTLEQKPDQEFPDVDMDAAALHRVFLNIMANAAEALENSREGEFEDAPAGGRKGCVYIALTYDGQNKVIRIEFSDNGPGLSDEERNRMFEPYFSGKKGGTGLGLTIVRAIVTEHRGYVRASRSESGGTAITIELPVV